MVCAVCRDMDGNCKEFVLILMFFLHIVLWDNDSNLRGKLCVKGARCVINKTKKKDYGENTIILYLRLY